MRRLLLCAFIFGLAACTGQAQDAATQQQLDKLAGQIQDLTDAQMTQNKRLDTLEKEINELTDKVNQQPAANNYATTDDLKKLAEQLQEIDQKRQDDRDLILKQLKELAKVGANSSRHVVAPPDDNPPADNGSATHDSTAANVAQNGHPYIIAKGDTLGAIARAYQEKGVKVTVKDIIAANPGLDATKLYVGKKIFIPDPALK
jgi:LysM repeat protein